MKIKNQTSKIKQKRSVFLTNTPHIISVVIGVDDPITIRKIKYEPVAAGRIIGSTSPNVSTIIWVSNKQS